MPLDLKDHSMLKKFISITTAALLLVTGLSVATAPSASASAVVSSHSVSGVTVPVYGAVGVSAITSETEFTGTVTWKFSSNGMPGSFSPITHPVTFAGGVYIAVITLTTDGVNYTMPISCTPSTFPVSGATVSCAVNSATQITLEATFPQLFAPIKTVNFQGSISAAIQATVASNPTYSLLTSNIADGQAASITWYTSGSGGTSTAAPTGISIVGSNVSSNQSTLTVTAGNSSVEGSYYFGVGIDGRGSPRMTLVVTAAPVGSPAPTPTPTPEPVQTAAEIAVAAAAVKVAAAAAAVVEAARVQAEAVSTARFVLDAILSGDKPGTLVQYQAAGFSISTTAVLDRLNAAVLGLSVSDRSDPAKVNALIAPIEFDEAFFNTTSRPTVATYISYGVSGVTDRTAPNVAKKVLELLIPNQSDVPAIGIQPSVEGFVGANASPQSFAEFSTSVLKAIQAIAVTEGFVDRVANPLTRTSVYASVLISEGLLSSDTPYKRSVVAGLQSYPEGSLNSMEKIAVAIKAELVKAQAPKLRLAAIKAKIAARLLK